MPVLVYYTSSSSLQFAAKQHLQPQQRVPPPPPEVKETKKKPPKRKRKKDPNEPQKPVSAYALFFRDTQAAIKGSNPNASFGEVSKIVASMWDSLEAEQKQVREYELRRINHLVQNQMMVFELGNTEQ